LDRLIEQSARIVTQIQNEARQGPALERFQLFDFVLQISGGPAVEAADADNHNPLLQSAQYCQRHDRGTDNRHPRAGSCGCFQDVDHYIGADLAAQMLCDLLW